MLDLVVDDGRAEDVGTLLLSLPIIDRCCIFVRKIKDLNTVWAATWTLGERRRGCLRGSGGRASVI